jgi:predicted small lipoprotein YifL
MCLPSLNVRALLLPSLALALAGCAASGPLEVPAGKVFELTSLRADPAPAVKVVDQRSTESSSLEPGAIRLPDSALAPRPPEALALALSAAMKERAASPHLTTLLSRAPVQLQSFELTVHDCDVSKSTSGHTMPGMAAVDVGMRNLAQAIGGCADVIVRFKVDIDGQPYLGAGAGRYPSAPGAWSTSRPFARAVESLVAQLNSLR